MGRIKRGGGNDGEPVRSPPSWSSFRRLSAGDLRRHDEQGVSAEINSAGTPKSTPSQNGRAFSNASGNIRRLLTPNRRSPSLPRLTLNPMQQTDDGEQYHNGEDDRDVAELVFCH